MRIRWIVGRRWLMSGAQATGEPSTTMRRIGVAKWLVCHTIKAAPTYFSLDETGYVICFMIHAIHSYANILFLSFRRITIRLRCHTCTTFMAWPILPRTRRRRHSLSLTWMIPVTSPTYHPTRSSWHTGTRGRLRKGMTLTLARNLWIQSW